MKIEAFVAKLALLLQKETAHLGLLWSGFILWFVMLAGDDIIAIFRRG